MNINEIFRRIPVMRRYAFLSWAVALVASGCPGGVDDGLTKFPVKGSVKVNGEPAAGMVVNFNGLGQGQAGNASRPVGRTDATGAYELSTNGDKDGAVEGEYAITFFWPSDEGALPTDLLGGKFSDPVRSKIKVSVAPKLNELAPFELDVDAKKLKAAKGRGNPQP